MHLKVVLREIQVGGELSGQFPFMQNVIATVPSSDLLHEIAAFRNIEYSGDEI